MARRPPRIPSHSIRPIVEFYPLKRTPSRGGLKWELLDGSHGRTAFIRKELRTSHGIYVFYNSQGRAIYLGKANQRNLWGEMKSAFNRKRQTQTIWRVRHPTIGTSFRPAYDKKRRIRRRKVLLHEIAAYVSVYEVGDRLINTLEGLMMRAFPNELTNARMEAIHFDKTDYVKNPRSTR